MLDLKAQALFTKLLKQYYQSSKPILPPDTSEREFGFGEFEKKIAYRHYGFKSTDELHKYLTDKAPPFVSYSAAHYDKPAVRPMEAKGWCGSDLIFDLDANDLHLKCVPAHATSWVCSNCLESVKQETIRLIEEFLIPDFGFSKGQIKVNFSGNRGYHVHVINSEVLKLDGDARKNISDYIAGSGIDMRLFFPELGRRGRRLDGPKPTDYGWRGKFASGVISALNKGTDALIELGVDHKLAKTLAAKRAEIILGIATTGNWDKVRITKKAEFWSNVLSQLAIKQSDSIDRNVTNDVHHLIRMPDTIHGDTGLIAKSFALGSIGQFDPMDSAIAFDKGTLKVMVGSAPQFMMHQRSFGPFKDQQIELPTYAALYLVLKRVATTC